jgi:hypothetical protein
VRFKKQTFAIAAGSLMMAAGFLVPAFSAGASPGGPTDPSSTSSQPVAPTGGPVPSALPIPYQASDIVVLAQAKAAYLGDANPSQIVHSLIVPRSLATSVATAGDTVNSDAPSMVIAIHGQFTTKASVPAPLAPMAATNPPPTVTYSYITLVVDATTGQVTDYGLSNTSPNMSALGPSTIDLSTS